GAINYVDGAGNYLYLSGASDAYQKGAGPDYSLENISGMAGTIGASFDVGGGSSVNIAYGMAKLDMDDYVDDIGGNPTEQLQNAFVNYMWTPVKSVTMGVEYGFFDKELKSGD